MNADFYSFIYLQMKGGFFMPLSILGVGDLSVVQNQLGFYGGCFRFPGKINICNLLNGHNIGTIMLISTVV